MVIDTAHTRSWSYAELRGDGMSRAGIERSLEVGALVRARRDHYVHGSAPEGITSAVRIGGRLDCVSLMRELGVFVLSDDRRLHVQIPRARTMLRSPHSRIVRLDNAAHGVVPHWREDPAPADSTIADPLSAVRQAVLCQPVRPAIATIDSALHLGIVEERQLGELFARLPRRLRRLRRLVDGRAESGPETLARLLVRVFGVSVELQVVIAGIGRVDLVVDGWIVIECDSREFHSGWDEQERDRARDLKLAARGFTTLRPTANQIFTAPSLLVHAVATLLERGPSAGVRRI
ncbi:endonuclease domain-containing protein [Microbacterium indicum]|uniref:endonuclease domain-containing protein n=1 Tax=Microbacterium indicum TaxID=358100 RepID=UPI00049077C1|nr:hypothetical protein [Microbacterium indicum]